MLLKPCSQSLSVVWNCRILSSLQASLYTRGFRLPWWLGCVAIVVEVFRCFVCTRDNGWFQTLLGRVGKKKAPHIDYQQLKEKGLYATVTRHCFSRHNGVISVLMIINYKYRIVKTLKEVMNNLVHAKRIFLVLYKSETAVLPILWLILCPTSLVKVSWALISLQVARLRLCHPLP